ncbi:MAG: hypothetical protein AAGG02_19640 [Cyanobacteria bacterium P01_H01_bin.15]
MSTTFDILPTTHKIPSITDVISLSNEKLDHYCQRYSILSRLRIDAEILSFTDQTFSEKCKDRIMKWDENQYAYFFLTNYTGGTVAYFGITNQLIRDIWADEIEAKGANHTKQVLIEEGLNIGHYWTFKRYSSQTLVHDLVYGIIAGSLTQITDGIIDTDDGAWSSSIFPATAKEFFSSYFILEAPVEPEYLEWSKSVIDSLRDLSQGVTKCLKSSDKEQSGG